MTAFWAMTALALAFGWVWIAPVGGGDMPVVVSLLTRSLVGQQQVLVLPLKTTC